MRGKSILVIPDSHARPNQSNRRFDALGQFILDKKPDYVVNIGDLADMGSLCSYDKGTGTAEGRRYSKDIAAANDALRRYHEPLKKLKVKPKFHITLGNHENRINRAAQQDPELIGTVKMSDINFDQYGYTVHKFLDPLMIRGVCFKHYFTSGVMARAISGENHARSLVKKTYQSAVCGHSHARDYWEDVRADGKRAFGLVVGCFDEGGHSYTTEQHRWWSGLVMLHEVQNGQAEPAFYSMKYVLDKYL